MTTEKAFIHRLVNREQKIRELFEIIDNADLIILSFPLYVDSLPAPVIKAMELIKEERDKIGRKNTKSFIAICNNGFPEASQNMVALEICRIFSKECGFAWKGGISIGGGAVVINGKPIEKRGGRARHIINGLDITANALKNNEELPQEAIDSILGKPVSPILYLTLVNLGIFFAIQRKLFIGLGSALLILGIITGNLIAFNLGILFSVIGVNVFFYGLIAHLKSKK
jgi:hypothetical protein